MSTQTWTKDSKYAVGTNRTAYVSDKGYRVVGHDINVAAARGGGRTVRIFTVYAPGDVEINGSGRLRDAKDAADRHLRLVSEAQRQLSAQEARASRAAIAIAYDEATFEHVSRMHYRAQVALRSLVLNEGALVPQAFEAVDELHTLAFTAAQQGDHAAAVSCATELLAKAEAAVKAQAESVGQPYVEAGGLREGDAAVMGPVILDPADDGTFTVYPTWLGVDRPRGTGMATRTRNDAERYRRAVIAGKVFIEPRVARDVHGSTYVTSRRTRVTGRHLRDDLALLGY